MSMSQPRRASRPMHGAVLTLIAALILHLTQSCGEPCLAKGLSQAPHAPQSA